VFRYYDTKPAGDTENYDQNHKFKLLVDHTFNDRYQLGLHDSFVVGQEPDTLRTVAGISDPQRISGNNIVNYGGLVFDAKLTPLLTVELGYNNGYFNYDDSFSTNGLNPGITGSRNADAFGNVNPSASGTLDRMQNTPNLDLRWQALPDTVGVLGFMYDQVDYTGDEPIAGNIFFPATLAMSDVRNSRSEIGYVGADHLFNPDLKGSLRIGIQHIDFYNDPNSGSDNSPYAKLTVSYAYAPQSHLEVGFSQNRGATDVTGSSSTNLVTDANISQLYGSIYHRIAPRLIGSVIGTFQNSSYNNGGPQFDGKNEQFYSLGLSLQYSFNTYLSADIGYNYDKVSSQISGRDYDRNRVYIGLTGTY
jgi:hypothetical protein